MSKRPATLRLSLTAATFLVGMAVLRAEDPSSGTDQKRRVVHVGNSHSHALYLIEHLAQAVGHKQTVGKINILGAPLWWNWDHPQQNKWPQVLDANNQWDAITLLAWDGQDEEYAVKFVTEAYKGNPDCEVPLYTIWPDGQRVVCHAAELR